MVEQILEFNDYSQTQNNFIDASNDNYNEELSYHHQVPSILDDLDWNDITQMIHEMDSMPAMSSNARQMARLHKEKIMSMRHKLSKEKLIMRASYKGYSFHTYSATEFQQKASKYIKETGIYKFINEVNPKNPKVSQKCLNEIIERVDITLKHLLYCKSITDAHYLFMNPQRSIVLLNYLHFVPDTYKVYFLSFHYY
jgi:hypothetical protein